MSSSMCEILNLSHNKLKSLDFLKVSNQLDFSIYLDFYCYCILLNWLFGNIPITYSYTDLLIGGYLIAANAICLFTIFNFT